jgi:thiamine pyrophosphate-dependent acetolactate synthase large subunit-like protein
MTIRLLEAYGVEVIFGIPGVHNVELYRGLEGSSIRHVTPRHEQGAGFMADGYARATGKVGVCFTVTRPGLTNIASAVEAQVPFVVLLWNNDGYAEIRNYMIDKGIAPLGVDLVVPDFITISRGFGCHAERINSFEQLAAELADAGNRTVPTVLEIRQDAAFLTCQPNTGAAASREAVLMPAAP